MRRRGLALLMLTACLQAGSASAGTYGLLVGVSGYPSLAPERRLQGPRNDVSLLRESLLRQGVPSAHLRVLADGVGTPLPTRANILRELDALGQRAHAGDWAVVYLSGHGAQQPRARQDGWREPDGRDEIFLPYDTGRWDGQIGSVRNAIVDDEIGAALRRLLDAGISVWAIFDTCHAGGMSKDWDPSAPPRQWRGVPAAALGVPEAPARFEPAAKGWHLAHRFGLPPPPAAPGAGTLVVFYGAAYDEPAAEEALPDQGGRAVHGVFTWHLARALAARQAASYEALLQSIRQAYRQEQRSISTPGAEGELALCLPFTNQTAPASDDCRRRASIAG